MSKIEELEARIKELEAKVNPPPAPPPFVPKTPYQQRDYTEAASNVVMPWMLEMAKAVPTDLVRDIVNDFRAGPATLRPLVPPSEEPPPAVATTVPLGKQPGIDAIDAIAKGFADRERLEEFAKLVDVASKLKGL